MIWSRLPSHLAALVEKVSEVMTKVQNAAGDKIEPATEDKALDADQDGLIDLDPAKVQATMIDLVQLDHDLRDQGTTLALLLRNYARTSAGIRF